MKSKKKSKSSDGGISFFYKFLPLFLYVCLFFNVWFVFSYVKSEKEDFSGVKQSVLNDVSNMYFFVQHSLSNELLKVRMSNHVFKDNFVRHSSSNSVSSVDDGFSFSSPSNTPTFLFPNDLISYRYFSASGSPCMQFEDGAIYKVGQDFGYGRIDRITHEIVVCDGRPYKRDRNFNLRQVDTFKSHDTYAMQRPDFLEGYHDELQFRQYERNVENSMRGLSSSQYNVPQVQMKEGM